MYTITNLPIYNNNFGSNLAAKIDSVSKSDYWTFRFTIRFVHQRHPKNVRRPSWKDASATWCRSVMKYPHFEEVEWGSDFHPSPAPNEIVGISQVCVLESKNMSKGERNAEAGDWLFMRWIQCMAVFVIILQSETCALRRVDLSMQNCIPTNESLSSKRCSIYECICVANFYTF